MTLLRQKETPDLPTVAKGSDLAVWLLEPKKKTPTRLTGRGGFEAVTTLARGRLKRALCVRWPPKDGQPTPTLEPERFPMSADRAPLASGRAAHADDGVLAKLAMNGCAFMKRISARLCT